MVQSKLDSIVNYPELKEIDPDDIDYDAPVYEVSIKDIRVNIALGKPQYAFVDNSIIYFAIYLVKGEKILSQIGIYEILEEDLANVTDEEGDLDLKNISQPLLYSFVTEDILSKSLTNQDENKQIEKAQNTDGVKSEKNDNFDDSKAENWVQSYMRNMSYGVKDNEGGGDCFFAAIRDGLSTIGKQVTVNDLRTRLSNAATPELYEQYRRIYDDLAKGVEDINKQIKQEMENAKELKKQVENVKVRKEKALLLEQAKELRDKIKKLREEKQMNNGILDEFKWIAKLTSFPKFVKAIRTCSFWADDWATSVMERLYNIKIILLSEESYQEGDLNNVLRCGRGDDELMSKNLFRPTDYIMMVYTGNHYKLVTVDGKGAFTYNELPKDIVGLIKDKCLEKNAGIYSIIPEFVEGLDELDEEVEEPGNLHLYNENTVFQFYDQAATKPAPGKGSGEMMGPEGVVAYKGLTGDWRRKLSHGYEKPFKLDEHLWNTVEHYVEANKYVNENPDFYVKFALDSGSELSKNLDMLKSIRSGKKYEGEMIKPSNVQEDEDWDDDKMSNVLGKALNEKFKDVEMASILKNTKDAKLMLYRKGRPARIEVEMMRIRKNL